MVYIECPGLKRQNLINFFLSRQVEMPLVPLVKGPIPRILGRDPSFVIMIVKGQIEAGIFIRFETHFCMQGPFGIITEVAFPSVFIVIRTQTRVLVVFVKIIREPVPVRIPITVSQPVIKFVNLGAMV